MTFRVETSPKFARNKPAYVEQQRRMVIADFKRLGQTSHSGAATLLPFVINYCETEGIAYALTALPGRGYHIQRIHEVG